MNTALLHIVSVSFPPQHSGACTYSRSEYFGCILQFAIRGTYVSRVTLQSQARVLELGRPSLSSLNERESRNTPKHYKKAARWDTKYGQCIKRVTVTLSATFSFELLPTAFLFLIIFKQLLVIRKVGALALSPHKELRKNDHH